MGVQTARAGEKLSQVYYTICPVKVASHLAMHQGFFDQAFARDHVEFTHISTLPANQWAVHYTHNHPHFFRDGGNIPPLWTRAEGADTVLIGLSFARRRQSILVAQDSAITSVRDLRGKTVSLPQRQDEIDFYRAMAHRGILVALQLHGIDPEEVKFVDVPATKAMSTQEGGGSVWSTKSDSTVAYGEEVAALLEGKVEAIYQSGGRVGMVLATGAVRSICDLDTSPDLFARVSNCDPAVITVSGTLARQYPERVVHYLEAALRGAAWAQQQQDEAIRILAKETFTTEESFRASFPPDFYQTLEPELSEQGLAALEIQKQFLLDHTYIERDFSLQEWADASFLEAARVNIGGDRG
jgi:ABC-type nitrate/sulfonate/bicarbonate transport system substrate-binding protein